MKHEESDRDLGSGLKLIMGFFDFLKNKKQGLWFNINYTKL